MSLSKPMRPTTSSRLRSAKSGSNSKSSVIIPQLQKSSSTETLTDKSEFLSKNQTVRKELKETVRKLEEWLKEAEVILKEPLRFNQKWTQEAIDVKKKEIQNLHQDIEAQNERIKTILELCATVDAQYAKRLKRRRLKPPAKKCSVLQSVGKIIEERWHCIWLRSLEWQCFLEQFTHSSKLKVFPTRNSLSGTGEKSAGGSVSHLQSSGLRKEKMNTSSCSDSSSLADGISSSAEAICEAEATNNRKNSSPNIGIRHSTPSKTGLRFIVADSDSEGESSLPDLKGNTSKCETTFSRTTFANNAGYPNCGTFFVQHVSDDEAIYNLNSLDENENSSSAYASPNSIRKLVNGADQLVFLTPVDDSDVDYRPKGQSNLRPEVKTQRSHSFHASSKSLMSSDEEDDELDQMDCGRDSHNPSLKDASSLSQLVDSVVAEVHQSMLNEAISQDEDECLLKPSLEASKENNEAELFLPESTTEAEKVVPKIIIDDVVRTNEEEELSDFWDQEKYLSEHNYDEPIDVDSTLKLLNFGDDYSKFIDSMSDEFSDLDQGTVKPQRTKRKIRRSTVKGSHYDSMSDSETDDAWKAVLLSRTKLNEVKQRLRNLEEEDQFTQNSVELTILKDVCYENIDCILKLLDESGAENSTVVVLKKTERSFKGLLKQWQEILQMIVQRLQLAETYGKIMDNVHKLETNLQKSKLPHEQDEIFHRKEDLQQHIENLKTSLVDLSGQKSDLFRVNVEIHNFLAELSCCPGVVFNTPPSSLGRKDHGKHRQMMMTSDHNNPLETQDQQQQLYPHHLQHFPPRKETSITKGLKDHVVGLYSTWDEAFHKTNTQLVNAQSTYANLLQFEIESKRLGNIKGSQNHDSTGSTSQRQQHNRRKKMDSLSLTEDSGISESCDDSEEAILTKMKLLAQDLEQKLSLDSNLVQEIALTLKTSTSDLEERLQVETTNAISARVHRLCAETQTNDFEDDEDDFTVDHKSVNGWFRRIMRFALPVQFFLMVMLFFAWNSTDHHHGFFHGGCNGVSRFHFLYPELKYINGPPPI